MPLPVSLDPARRGTWESGLARTAPQPLNTTLRESADSGPVGSQLAPQASQTVVVEQASEPTQVTSTERTSAFASDTADDHPSTPQAASSLSPIPSDDLPPLQGSETYASSSYKARVIGNHITEQLVRYRNGSPHGPLMVGLQGPQGCGKVVIMSLSSR